MTERDPSRRRRSPMGERQPAPELNPAPGDGDVAGLVGPADGSRSGDDVRRRGWFWHWNSIVTQYAPLIGLKGVGLLNSYTVWTDRREESPHRGYAFPSQQREADFYGEDRAELITINKILVALDLIEIRKEMVLRTDEQGRRWRVPHNFYRVKDHGDGFTLTAKAVLDVVALADRDKAVYRYVRRIFSPRFSPIDPDNVWNAILPELRQTDLWQRLAARAVQEEDRASARTRAGHAARKASLGMPEAGDTATTDSEGNDSEHVESITSLETIVATANRGSTIDVDATNDGLTVSGPTSVEPSNQGMPTAVAPANTTYDQAGLTTTTTGSTASRIENEEGSPPANLAVGPGETPGELLAIRAFEDANARRSTPAERQLLRGLAARFETTAGVRTGWDWVAAAIYEAVEAGSAYVAPRRLREILTRWEREGFPGDADHPKQEPAPARSPADLLGEGPDLTLPHGFGSRQTWAYTVGLLGSALDRARLAELVAGTAIVGYRDGEVTLAAPDAARAARLATEYRDLVARKLSEAMRRPVRLAVLTAAPPEDAAPTASTPPDVPSTHDRADDEDTALDDEPIAPNFMIEECGLPSGQVWGVGVDR